MRETAQVIRMCLPDAILELSHATREGAGKVPHPGPDNLVCLRWRGFREVSASAWHAIPGLPHGGRVHYQNSFSKGPSTLCHCPLNACVKLCWQLLSLYPLFASVGLQSPCQDSDSVEKS